MRTAWKHQKASASGDQTFSHWLRLRLSFQQIGDKLSMPYRDRLNYWVIVRHLPNFQRIVVDRYHRRSDAYGHLKILQQKVPDAEFELVFDVSDR